MRPDVPSEAAATIDASLRRDPAARPARAAALAEASRRAATQAGYPAAAPALEALALRAAPEHVIRLAGMDERRQPSAPPPPTEDAVTRGATRPLPRDTVVDLTAGQVAAMLGEDDRDIG